MPLPIETRAATAEDLPYILSTWVRSFGSGVPSGRRQSAIATFRRGYVDRVMRERPAIYVLCSPESRNTLHGYAVVHAGALIWAYVTRDLRQMGLAHQAIEAALGAYPDAITARSRWPFESARFRFDPFPSPPAKESPRP